MSCNTKHRSIKNCQLMSISQLHNYVYISYNFIFMKVFSQLNTQILRNGPNLHLLIKICIIRSSRSTMVGVVRYSLTQDLFIKSNFKTWYWRIGIFERIEIHFLRIHQWNLVSTSASSYNWKWYVSYHLIWCSYNSLKSILYRNLW